MPLSVTRMALHVGSREGFHQHVLTHLCLAAAAGLESEHSVCDTGTTACEAAGLGQAAKQPQQHSQFAHTLHYQL